MFSLTEDYLKVILNSVAEKEKLQNWRFKTKNFDDIGQNYFGVIVPAVITGEIDGKIISINVVLKVAPNDTRFRVSGAITLMFTREMYFYDTVLKKYNEIQRSFDTNLRYISPKCYFVRNEYCKEALVLEDMTKENYKPCSTTLFLDFEHTMLAIEMLAKLHALSFVLKDKFNDNYHESVEICVPLSAATNKRFIEILNDRMAKALIKFQNTKFIKLLEKLKEDLVEIVEGTATNVKETAICHGDIWKENILFRYENEKPISACIIDYQTARMSSPAFDFLYLITSSTHTETRKTHFSTYIDRYYATFKSILSKCDTVVRYCKEDFKDDLKTVAPACLIIANTAIWLYSGLQEEGHVKSKITFANDEERQIAVDVYKRRIADIIEDYNLLGLLVF